MGSRLAAAVSCVVVFRIAMEWVWKLEQVPVYQKDGRRAAKKTRKNVTLLKFPSK